jgi:long-chain acyl-CoA synthetase
VQLSQYNLLVEAHGMAQWQQVDAQTRMMCVLPIHHVNGILVTLMLPLYAGGSVVLCRSFKVNLFWRRLAQEGVHSVSVVPTLLQFLCEADADVTRYDLHRLRYIICGAGTLAVGLVARFEERFGVRILHGYGLSETTAFASKMPIDLSDDAHRHWLRDFGYPSIGVDFGANEMQIHDAQGNALPPGARGEIVIRGHNVMLGYFRRPDANEETFKHGWFRSGDEGFHHVDEQGRKFFFITGRIKELINRGGVKYSPFEIEEVLLEIPGVKVALAIAFDNDWYGEEVGAYVVAHEGAKLSEAQVLAHCRACMGFAKAPKVVKFGSEAPVTTTGKYQRLRLKALFVDYRAVQFKEAR